MGSHSGMGPVRGGIVYLVGYPVISIASDTSCSDSIHIESADPGVQPGNYASGWWIIGGNAYRNDSTYHVLADDEIYCCSIGSNYESFGVKKIFYSLTANVTSSSTALVASSFGYADAKQLAKRVYSRAYSNVVKEGISFYEPTFTMYTCKDSGTLEFDCYVYYNCYNYKRRAGMTNHNCWAFASAQIWQSWLAGVYRTKDNVNYTLLAELNYTSTGRDAPAGTVDRLVHVTCDVTAGEKLSLESLLVMMRL